MSEIRANTVSNAAGTGPVTLTGQDPAKSWINLNAIGTLAVRDSFNVASVTDNSTGNHTINFSSSMANTDYSPSGITQGGGTSSSFTNIQGGGSATNVLTASAAPMRVTSPGAGQVDVSVCNFQFHGDLA